MVNITYKYNDLEEARALTPVADSKMQMLQKFTTEEASVLCEIEFEKITAHQTGKIYSIKANTTIDGTLYRAEATEMSFEEALDEVRSELDKKLRRSKDKQSSLLRRAGRKLKSTLLRR